MPMAMGAGCQARMRSDVWTRWRICGNPVKGALMDGTSVCGIHLAVERKQAQRNEEYDRHKAGQDRLREEARAACENLAHAGIGATPEYNRGAHEGGYTGMVVVSPSEILAAINALRARSVQRGAK